MIDRHKQEQRLRRWFARETRVVRRRAPSKASRENNRPKPLPPEPTTARKPAVTRPSSESSKNLSTESNFLVIIFYR